MVVIAKVVQLHPPGACLRLMVKVEIDLREGGRVEEHKAPTDNLTLLSSSR